MAFALPAFAQTFDVQVSLGFGALAVALSAATVLVVFGAAYLLRARLLHWLRSVAYIRVLVAFSEPALAIAVSVVGSVFDLFKPATWQAPGANAVLGFPLWSGLAAGYLTLKGLTGLAKEKDADEIKALKAAATEAGVRASRLLRQRDFISSVAQFVRAPVQAKLQRLLEVFRRPHFTIEDYLNALAPREQVQVIINTIHQFFAAQLEPGTPLRLGLYMRDGENSHLLHPAYSFDGHHRECFSSQAHQLRIDDPAGSKSLIVQAFLSEKKLHVVSSCREAHRRGEFFYYRPEQTEYLRSIFAYKHIWLRGDGARDAFVLTLDTSCDGFFGRFSEEELLPFLAEMMKRLEYEVLGMQIQAVLSSSPITPPS